MLKQQTIYFGWFGRFSFQQEIEMRKCYVYINAGRNTNGVWKDTVAWLAKHGWAPVYVCLVALDDEDARSTSFQPDEAVMVEWLCVNSRGVALPSPDADVARPATELRVFVMNGGTTPQQWWQHEAAVAGYHIAAQTAAVYDAGG